MKQLRPLRITVATLFFVATVCYVSALPYIGHFGRFSEKSQIMLSMIPVTFGTILVWLLITLLFGRIYCSSVCPVGTLSDLFISGGSLWRRLRKKPVYRFRYRHPRPWTMHVLVIYLLCLMAGLLWVSAILEPWNIMRNILAVATPTAEETGWISLGVGLGAGFITGGVSFIILLLVAVESGRAYCTDFCPVGALLGFVSNRSLYHIEINPDKCISCGLCEEKCKSSCIKVVSRYVDNARCVRCFDCIDICPSDAIRYQSDRNRPLQPLFRRRKRVAP